MRVTSFCTFDFLFSLSLKQTIQALNYENVFVCIGLPFFVLFKFINLMRNHAFKYVLDSFSNSNIYNYRFILP